MPYRELAARASRSLVLQLALAAPLLAACAQPAAYRDPIERFQLASAMVIEGARGEYATVNKRERDAEIDRRVARGKAIDLPSLDEKALLEPDELRARLAALDALAKHGRLLLVLASSDAPARAGAAADSLGSSLGELRESLVRAAPGDITTRATGFAALAGQAAELALQAKIAEALDRAILASDRDVTGLIGLLRQELGALYERRRTLLSGARTLATDRYNAELAAARADPVQLRKAAEQIKQAEDAWEQLPLTQAAGPALDAMADAHRELAEYARSGKRPQDLAELVEATDAFATRARVIADSIRAIRGAGDPLP